MQLETSSNIILNETPGPRTFPTAICPSVSRLRHKALPLAQRYVPVIADWFWIIDSEIRSTAPQRDIRATQLPIERPSQKPVTSTSGASGGGESSAQLSAAKPAIRPRTSHHPETPGAANEVRGNCNGTKRPCGLFTIDRHLGARGRCAISIR